jgi:hypothetical protein
MLKISDNRCDVARGDPEPKGAGAASQVSRAETAGLYANGCRVVVMGCPRFDGKAWNLLLKIILEPAGGLIGDRGCFVVMRESHVRAPKRVSDVSSGH